MGFAYIDMKGGYNFAAHPCGNPTSTKKLPQPIHGEIPEASYHAGFFSFLPPFPNPGIGATMRKSETA
jgi:hypothetical protein